MPICHKHGDSPIQHSEKEGDCPACRQYKNIKERYNKRCQNMLADMKATSNDLDKVCEENDQLQADLAHHQREAALMVRALIEAEDLAVRIVALWKLRPAQ